MEYKQFLEGEPLCNFLQLYVILCTCGWDWQIHFQKDEPVSFDYAFKLKREFNAPKARRKVELIHSVFFSLKTEMHDVLLSKRL